MNKTTKARPAIMEMIPWFCASLPRVGPMMLSSTIWVGAGSEPDFKMLAKSWASKRVKLPEISDCPFGISPFTIGAVYT